MWQIGAFTIAKVAEIKGPLPAGAEAFLLPDAVPDVVRSIEWLVPDYATEQGALRTSVQSFVVETPDGCVLVDTGIGNAKPRSVPQYDDLDTDFVERLATAGAQRDRVAAVICTHLHVDHVGWNTMLKGERWVPTFPEAKYYVPRDDWDDYMSDPNRIDAAVFKQDSIDPIVESGQLVPTDSDAEVVPGVRFLPTPGHTAGHGCVSLESEGRRAVITGDVMLHPAQIAHPEWTSPLDSDAAHAERIRREFLESFADSGVLILGTHFADPVGGYVVRDGSTFRFQPE